MKNKILISLLFIAILALAACGGGAAKERASEPEANSAEAELSQPQEETITESIEVVMNDIYYGDSNDNATNPPVWTVSEGADVNVNLINNGGLEHNWAVVQLGEQISEVYNEATDQAKLLFDPGVVAGGQEETFDFSAPLPGEYQVICTVPGHLQIMQGKLVVE